MEEYQNIAGNSGVTAYETGPDYITIVFSDGSVYHYTYASAGEQNIERMKGLAAEGQGLNTFITTAVSKLFERKEK